MPAKANPASAGKAKLNSKRSRKSRTEVFSSSSEDSSSSSDPSSSDTDSSSSAASPSPSANPTARETKQPTRSASPPPSEPDSLPASAAAAAFAPWYLRTVTQELAEDLDKVRSAPDFGDAALPLLVHALQQGEACFSVAEKARVVRGGSG